MHQIRSLLAIATAAAILAGSPQAEAQQQDWFVPGQQKAGQQRPPAKPARPQSAPAVQTPLQSPLAAPQGQTDSDPAPTEARGQYQLPPAPDLPALTKGTSPPAAVLGVLGVPDVMRASSAAQAVEKVVGERRDKLNQDAQKEQSSWRDLQQALTSQRATLSPEQIRNREKELQDRITNSQKQLRDRNRLIQETAQYCLAQIERTLVAVIRQVADSHGMNLVLHRAQVALNVAEFDITDQVTEELNKILPKVIIPPEGVDPPRLAQSAAPPGGGTPPPTPTPASASAAPAPAPAAQTKPN